MLTGRHFYVYSCLVLAATAEQAEETEVETYSGYRVVSTVPYSMDLVTVLRKIQDNITDCSLDWWNDPSKPNVSVSVLVPPQCLESLTSQLTTAGLPYDITVQHLKKLIDEEEEYRFFALLHKATDNWSNEIYHNLEEIKSRMSWIVQTYPDLGDNSSL